MWLDDYPMLCVGLDASRFLVGACNPLQGVKDSPINLRIPVMMVFWSWYVEEAILSSRAFLVWNYMRHIGISRCLEILGQARNKQNLWESSNFLTLSEDSARLPRSTQKDSLIWIYEVQWVQCQRLQPLAVEKWDFAPSNCATPEECIGNDMLGLLKVLGKSCYALVGHDWGGILVWHLACLFPEAFPRSLTSKSSFWCCRFVPWENP